MKQAFYDKITLGPRTKRKEGYETDIVNCRIQARAWCSSDFGFMSRAAIEMLNDIEDNKGG